jgi:hypothetical protein
MACFTWLFAALNGRRQPEGLVDVVRREKKHLRQEQRSLEREAQKLEREAQKAISQAKKEVRKGNREGAVVIAREVTNTRQHAVKLKHAANQVAIIASEMGAQMAQVRVGATLAVTAQLLEAMNRLYSLERTRALVQTFAAELDRLHVADEMLSGALESAMEQTGDDVAEDEDEQLVLQQVMHEIMPRAPSLRPPAIPLPEDTVSATTAEDYGEDVALVPPGGGGGAAVMEHI